MTTAAATALTTALTTPLTSQGGIAERASRYAVFAVAALLLVGSGQAMMAHHASMSSVAAIPMAGGWTLSPVWTPMCGGTWPRAAASFVGMWAAMMTAMMLPTLMAMLWRYRRALVARSPMRRTASMLLAGACYLAVWFGLGVLLFPLGAATASLLLDRPDLARAAPLASGLAVFAAGALQWSGWKARHLRHCRAVPEAAVGLAPGMWAVCRHGLRMGAHCNLSCAGMTASLLALGVMDPGAMAVMTVAVTTERLSTAPRRCARAIGVILGAYGVCLIVPALYALYAL